MAGRDTDSEQPDALEHRFRQLRGPLLAWFRRRLGDTSEAEDLVQESFMRITLRGDQASLAHFEAYLYRTARSVLSDRLRRRTVRQAEAHVPLEPERDETPGSDALAALLARERLGRVSARLEALPERTRAIFILCRLDGLRYAEIATRFDISVSAVQKHMLRAIEALLPEEEA